MKILVINAGSSSLKYQLFEMDNKEVLAKGICERIGFGGGKIKHSALGKENFEANIEFETHRDAIIEVVRLLTDKKYGIIKDMSEIAAVGHRVLHGGEKFSGSVLIDDKVLDAIEECVELGPLHNPANIIGIRSCGEAMPDKPQVAVFDTGFGQTMPKYAYLYALPYEMYKKLHIRRYGFHGTSHRYVSQRAAAFMGRDPKELKLITCHLGNGSSISAIDGGKCIDTSMGLTPLEGLMMGTRCGSIDPAIITFLIDKGMTSQQVNDMMNKESGFIGISEVSSDYRDMSEAGNNGNEKCKLAMKMFNYQIIKYIGSYAAAMGGLDAIVFTGGIGENTIELREEVSNQFKFMGAGVDPVKNNVRGKEVDISADEAKVRTLIIPTNEELMIAMDTEEIISK